MANIIKKVLFFSIFLLWCGGTTYAGVSWEDLWTTIEQKSQQETGSGQPQPNQGWVLDLGFLRDPTGFSREEEVAIGRQAAGNILSVAPLVNDATLQQYVNRVGRWVASQGERSDLAWRFGVIESNDLNAFATPGGYVFITKGLYRALQSESELAGVLAHEIAHVIKKHHLKANLLGNGADIFTRSLDKNDEFEADRMAVILAARAGYDPFGLPTVLQDLGRVPKEDSRVSLLFKTHPHPDDRLVQLGEAIGDRLDGVKGQTLANRFYRIKP
jgi:predicted Zn-dependent protease